jgi:putative hydrolase of the HAD superfamily
VTIKAVAFDIDGTLYPEFALRARLGFFAAKHARFLLAFASARRKLHALVETSSETPADLPGFRRLQAKLIAERLALAPSEAEAQAERIVYTELDSYFAHLPVFKGLERALDDLESAGLRLAALSDFPAGRKLGLLGLSGRFEVAQCSEDCGLLKPAARPFLRLAQALGLKCEEILYVGNSRRYDVRGSRNAGMRAALLSPSRISAEADLAFSRWGDLVSFARESSERLGADYPR